MLVCSAVGGGCAKSHARTAPCGRDGGDGLWALDARGFIPSQHVRLASSSCLLRSHSWPTDKETADKDSSLSRKSVARLQIKQTRHRTRQPPWVSSNILDGYRVSDALLSEKDLCTT